MAIKDSGMQRQGKSQPPRASVSLLSDGLSVRGDGTHVIFVLSDTTDLVSLSQHLHGCLRTNNWRFEPAQQSTLCILSMAGLYCMHSSFFYSKHRILIVRCSLGLVLHDLLRTYTDSSSGMQGNKYNIKVCTGRSLQ